MQTFINIIAIILSPVIALVVGRLLEARREKYRHKFYIFSTLLSLRHQKLDTEVIRAMNTIDVVFQESPIRNIWREYRRIALDDAEKPDFGERLDKKYVELVHEIGKVLGYKDKITLFEIAEPYTPKYFVDQFFNSSQALLALKEVLSGDRPLFIAVHPDFVTQPETSLDSSSDSDGTSERPPIQ